jgi:hypothetical protein
MRRAGLQSGSNMGSPPTAGFLLSSGIQELVEVCR